MSKRNLIVTSFLTAILVLAFVFPIKSQFTTQNNDIGLVAGRNVNMVHDDPYLQRQNEPSIAVSTLNPRHLLAGANDYYLIDAAGDMTEDVTTDAWLGVYRSYDGGQSWQSDLILGYERNHDSPLTGMDAAADPTIRSGADGWFYYSGIAFQRKRKGDSVVFVARFKDNGHSIDYVDTTVIDEGTSGQFQDKPWIGTDKNGRVYVIYSIFLGEINNNIHSKIMISRSENGGSTWESPSKLSESQLKNQGTTIAIDQGGVLYVAWRRFASVNATDAILITKSEDHGATFTKAEEVATIDFPFDQPTMGTQSGPSQFRTNTYPTIALDETGRIYLAWSQRLSLGGDARIVITSLAGSDWGSSWPAAVTVEPLSIDDPRERGEIDMPCHQIMPTLVYGAGQLLLAWYDTRFSARRYDEFGALRSDAPGPYPWIMDGVSDYRETMDVRLAQADPGPSPAFSASIQVSRYLWVLEADPNQEGKFRLRQGQFNPPNYKMYSGGTVPFHGDYIDIAHSPDDPFTFYVTWTDNRDVSPPGNDSFWGDYTPPELFDPGNSPCDVDPNAVLVGMRNQNIYCSRITRGIEIGTLNNNQAPGDNSFVIFINNLLNPPDPEDPYASLTFNLSLDPDGQASFSPLSETQLTDITVTVPYYSSIVRQVFFSGAAGQTEAVRVWTEDAGFDDEISLNVVAGGISGGSASLVIDGTTKIDWSDPQLISTLNPNITNSTTNPNITNPNITNPNITNPNITNPNITNPNITNPNITNPNITNPNITNPNITNPNITNPNITNPNITNPNITNPNITNIPPAGTKIADKVWSVHNEGDAVSAYTFKGIAGDSLPSDEYIYTQLLIYKVHYTHSTNGCYLMTEAHHELLVNVISPLLTTDTTGWTEADINKFIGDPEAYNSTINNATFSLAPGEYAVLLLRVIDTKPDRGGLTVSTTSKAETLFDEPSAYVEEVGSVVVSHSSSESSPTGSASLTVLPAGLPSGVKAGEVFPPTSIRAIGGTLAEGSDYSWGLIGGALPEDVTLVDSLLSGFVRRIGPFSFKVEVMDDNGDTDTHTFSAEILPPDPLELDVILTPPPAPYTEYTEGYSYTIQTPLAIYSVSGGVPQYSWTFTETPVVPTSTPSGLSLQPTGNPGEMALVGTLEAGEWNISVKVTDDRLPMDANAFAEQPFTLCVAPLPMKINLPAASEFEWSLGTPHAVQITVSNAKTQPIWTVDGLPEGFSADLSGSPMEITGLPAYDPNLDYPATYPITISVTDMFTWCGFGPRVETASINIVVNPKVPEWSVEENNGGVATAVTADPDGNTCVTGYTGIEGNRDYYTVKYSSEGVLAWSIPYDGPLSGDDVPTAIAADATGVYVTGTSEGSTSGPDIYTVKYAPDNGNVIWESRYDGPSHMGDGANAIFVDDGFVYVAGFVHRGNKTAHADYVTIKFDRLTGEIEWAETADSRRNGKDYAMAVAVDLAGNVFVTGKSQESLSKVDTSFDFYTLKYNSSGRLQWDVRDDGQGFGDDEPTAIAVDAAGNVYVTGQENSGASDTDFYTVKYNDLGQLVWAAGQSYGGTGEDRALAIAFDDTGDVFVTGKIKSADGYDYVTLKYDGSAAGTKLWENILPGAHGDDMPVGLAYSTESGNGFVLVAGFKSTENNGKDFFSVKYKAFDGSIAWIAQYNSGAGLDDEATDMFMNETGIYVTGFTLNGYLTVKYTK